MQTAVNKILKTKTELMSILTYFRGVEKKIAKPLGEGGVGQPYQCTDTELEFIRKLSHDLVHGVKPLQKHRSPVSCEGNTTCAAALLKPVPESAPFFLYLQYHSRMALGFARTGYMF